MNKETKDQIENAAQQHADNCIFSPYDNHRGIARASYIAGAETWAERGEVLKEALEKIVDLAIKMGEDATEIWAIADDSLTKWADEKR